MHFISTALKTTLSCVLNVDCYNDHKCLYLYHIFIIQHKIYTVLKTVFIFVIKTYRILAKSRREEPGNYKILMSPQVSSLRDWKSSKDLAQYQAALSGCQTDASLKQFEQEWPLQKNRSQKSTFSLLKKYFFCCYRFTKANESSPYNSLNTWLVNLTFMCFYYCAQFPIFRYIQARHFEIHKIIWFKQQQYCFHNMILLNPPRWWGLFGTQIHTAPHGLGKNVLNNKIKQQTHCTNYQTKSTHSIQHKVTIKVNTKQ